MTVSNPSFYPFQTNSAPILPKNHFYSKDDLENYTIKVHALKSSSRQIGAMELGDKAEALEKAGHNEDWDFIRSNTSDTLALYKELLNELKKTFP